MKQDCLMATHDTYRLLMLFLVVVGSLLYAKFKKAEGQAAVTTQKQAELALSELQKWGAFLIGLQTGAIGVMGFLFEKVRTPTSDLSLSPWLFTWGVFAVIFFGSSIVVATWLLGAIPSLMIRTNAQDCLENDVFHMSLFKMRKWPEVGPMTGLQYFLFSCGIVMFCIFVYIKVPQG